MTVRKLALFELHNVPSEADYEACREVWLAGSFPWQWCVQHNTRVSGGNPHIPIGFKDRDGSLGYYTPGMNFINVDPVAAQGYERFRLTLTHELTHLIDAAILSSASKVLIHKLLHDGSPVRFEDCPSGGVWRGGRSHQERPNEAFANVLPKLWCPPYSKSMTRYGPHYFTKLDEIWEVVMADTEDEYPFSDVEGTTHEDAILWAVGRGVVRGYSDGTFRPNEPLTRGQGAAMFHAYDKGSP